LPRRLLSFVRTRSPSYTRLVVGVSGEGLGIREDGDVALDEGDHDTTGGLDTERGGSDVEEEVLGLLRGVAGEMGV
jgi:hypothetical protein